MLLSFILSIFADTIDESGIMKDRDNIQTEYDRLMRDYQSSDFIRRDWQMKNGVYEQYSAYDNNDSCPSGTNDTIKALFI